MGVRRRCKLILIVIIRFREGWRLNIVVLTEASIPIMLVQETKMHEILT